MSESFFTKARKAMVESQLRPNRVIDERVIAAFSSVEREAFVPKSLREIAYIDEDIKLAGGRCVMEPMVLARLVQALDMEQRDTLLVHLDRASRLVLEGKDVQTITIGQLVGQ